MLKFIDFLTIDNSIIEELVLIDLIKQLGYSEDKIEELGVYNKYKLIHDSYTVVQDIEALKRAVFIQWYAVIEPGNYTGIGLLNTENEKKNILRLNNAIELGNMDTEFKLMLCHYYTIADWYFDSFKEINSLKKYLEKPDTGSVRRSLMINRGQMGVYWNSLVKVDDY